MSSIMEFIALLSNKLIAACDKSQIKAAFGKQWANGLDGRINDFLVFAQNYS